MSNSLRFVGPDLGPNCLPKLSADDTGIQRVKPYFEDSLCTFSLKSWFECFKSGMELLNFDLKFKLVLNFQEIVCIYNKYALVKPAFEELMCT